MMITIYKFLLLKVFSYSSERNFPRSTMSYRGRLYAPSKTQRMSSTEGFSVSASENFSLKCVSILKSWLLLPEYRITFKLARFFSIRMLS